MQRRFHRRKRFYSPGLISLILLPVLCLVSMRDHFSNNLYMLEILGYELPPIRPPEPDYVGQLNLRQFWEITLDSNKATNNIKLDFARLAIRELMATKDSVKGIQLTFSDGANYASFVKAFDVCNSEKANYLFYHDCIYVFNVTAGKSNTCLPTNGITGNFMCGTYYSEITVVHAGKLWREKFLAYWPAGILFIAMVMISGWRCWSGYRRGKEANKQYRRVCRTDNFF